MLLIVFFFLDILSEELDIVSVISSILVSLILECRVRKKKFYDIKLKIDMNLFVKCKEMVIKLSNVLMLWFRVIIFVLYNLRVEDYFFLSLRLWDLFLVLMFCFGFNRWMVCGFRMVIDNERFLF